MVLSDKDRKLINTHLAELKAIREDLEKAKKANVPNLQSIENVVEECENNCKAIKAVYFPEKS